MTTAAYPEQLPCSRGRMTAPSRATATVTTPLIPMPCRARPANSTVRVGAQAETREPPISVSSAG